MGTTAQKLQAIADSKAAIREALERKNISIGDAPLAEYAAKIDEIQVEKTSLSVDLKAIYDQYPEEPYRFVIQLEVDEFDDKKPIYFNDYSDLTKVVTSDGQTYTSFPVTHTWDTSKDIPEEYPHPMRTRWVIFCSASEEKLHNAVPYLHDRYVVSMFSDFSAGWVYTLRNMYFLRIGENQRTNKTFNFNECCQLRKIPTLDTTGKTSFGSMFSKCRSITEIPPIDTSAATSVVSMFAGCYSLKQIPQLDVSNAIDIGYMFNECSVLDSVPDLNFANATNAVRVFNKCYNLRHVGKLNLENAKSLEYLFGECESLTTIEELNMSSATNVNQMFLGCSRLKHIRFAGTVSIAPPISTLQNITRDSIISLFNALVDLTGETAKTISLYINVLRNLPEEVKAIATNKNWILK